MTMHFKQRPHQNAGFCDCNLNLSDIISGLFAGEGGPSHTHPYHCLWLCAGAQALFLL
jgi:hypothetical protein